MPFDADAFQPISGRTLRQGCHSVGSQTSLVFHPTVLYFHFVGIGQTSDWMPFVIENDGDKQIAIVDSILTGEFEIAEDLPAILLPGQTLTVSIRFKPTGLGARIGSLSLDTGTSPKPQVALVGIGGSITANIQVSAGDVEPIVNSLIEDKWGYRYGSFAVDNIIGNEILMDYQVTAEHTLQPAFAGSQFSAGVAPTADYVLRVLRDGVQIGTVTLKPDGTVLPATTGGLAQLIPTGSIVTVQAPQDADATVGRLRMTFVGVV